MTETENTGSRFWLTIAGIVGLSAVICGAFGAHGIEEAIPGWYTESDLKQKDKDETGSNGVGDQPVWYRLDQLHHEKLRTWITGVRYHFYHTFAIMAVGLIQYLSTTRSRRLDIAAILFLLGIIGFSGSIYLYVITKIKILGMTAALGGVIFLGGWLFFVWGVAQLSGRGNDNPMD